MQDISRNLFHAVIKISEPGSLSTISAYLFLTSTVSVSLKGGVTVMMMVVKGLPWLSALHCLLSAAVHALPPLAPSAP